GRRTVRGRAHVTLGRAACRVQRVAGQVGHQVLGHRHRTHTGPAATVRDAERLVQVQVGDVTTETARPAPADQRVQVGAVDVHLATCGVHQLAQLGDPGLVDPVRGGVGDHDGGDAALV